MNGKVYLIGAGPGDPGLLTLKARDAIASADVLVYDRLVSSRILGHARPSAERIYVGKRPDHHAMQQEDISRLLASLALEGKTVARVKGGDPFVFGRGGEEAEELVRQGVPFEVVPGITSAISVPAYAGIPVTHRDVCASFHVLTGHEREEKGGSTHDFSVLARLEGTLVFLMGVASLEENCRRLVENGKSASTPVAVIERGTWQEQRCVTGTLENIAAVVAAEGIRSPAVTVIGGVVSLQETLAWFPQSMGPLAGVRVVVTRAREQASVLTDKIAALGGETVEMPVIRIAPPVHPEQVDQAIASLQAGDFAVFTSTNGVDGFMERLRATGRDIRSLAGVRVAAIGRITAERLRNAGIFPDVVPENYTASALGKALTGLEIKGARAVLFRTDIAPEELAVTLRNAGFVVQDVIAYRTLFEPLEEGLLEKTREEGVDAITFTSSSTVRHFVAAGGKTLLDGPERPKVISIGPVTSETAAQMNIPVDAEAAEYTLDGLVDALRSLFRKENI